MQPSATRHRDYSGEKFLMETALIGSLAGVCSGVMEFGAGVVASGFSIAAGSAMALVIECSLLGVCGFIFGSLLALIVRFAAWDMGIKIKLAILAAAAVLVAVRYETAPAITLGAVSAGLIAFSWMRRSTVVIASFIVWLALFLTLKPFFSGNAMELVFTGFQTLLIMLLVMALTFGLILLITADAMGLAQGRSRITFIKITLSVAAAAALTALSSVFLIRLWGFNTMEYLQAIMIALWIGLLMVPVRWLARMAGVTGSASIGKLTAATAIALIAMVVFSATVAADNPQVRKRISSKAPNSNMLMQAAAIAVDMDSDGYSSIMGYGDCDDTKAFIHPLAIDIPGNGLDVNCFGGDLKDIEHGYLSAPIQVTLPDVKKQRKRKVAVFVIVDTLRADMVDYRTGQVSRTPVLSDIARASTRFTRVYAQSNNTLESTPFFFQLGFRNIPWHNSDWTLARYLTRAGIRTAGVFQASVAEWWGEMKLGAKLFDFDTTFRPNSSVRSYAMAQVTVRAVELLSENDGRDLFLFGHFEALHDFFTHRMEGDRMVGQGLNINEVARLWDAGGLAAVTKEKYRGVLGIVDKSLGPIWEKARELEKEAEVLFVVSSDHGEEIYEHGGLFHMSSLYEETVRVPLIIYRTGGEHRTRGEPTAVYAVAPTIMGFFGFGGATIEELDLFGAGAKSHDIFSYYLWRSNTSQRIFSIVEGDWKMIYNPSEGLVEMYDLATDPGEINDLAGEETHAGKQRELEKKMDTTMFYMNYGDMALRQMKKRGVKDSQ